MIDKILEKISKRKGLLLLLVFIIPFILIPLVALILKLSLIVGNRLPSWMILMRIDTEEIVSTSTFIYYYTCFLAIEVTGILSYALYRFSVNKEDSDKNVRDKEKKIQNVKKIIQIYHELEENYKKYTKERGNLKWSFYKGLEGENSGKQFGYNEYGQEFNSDKWQDLKGDLNIIFIELENIGLFESIESIYESLDQIKYHRDVNELDVPLFSNLNKKFINVIEETKKIINYLSY